MQNTKCPHLPAGGEPQDAQRASTTPAPPRQARDLYCYFDNDIKVHAPFDAQALQRHLERSVQSGGLPEILPRSS